MPGIYISKKQNYNTSEELSGSQQPLYSYNFPNQSSFDIVSFLVTSFPFPCTISSYIVALCTVVCYYTVLVLWFYFKSSLFCSGSFWSSRAVLDSNVYGTADTLATISTRAVCHLSFANVAKRIANKEKVIGRQPHFFSEGRGCI